MNRDEAKYILRSYHVGGKDADDPQFQEALELLKHDPALAEWFAQEQAIDTRLSEKFRSFPVPPDLNTQLLAARKIVQLPKWWQRPAWIGAAACILLLAALTPLFLNKPGTLPFAEFRSLVADTTAQLDRLDILNTNIVEVRQWLRERHAPSDFIIPAGLKGRPSIGCRRFEWKGQLVSLVCFKLEEHGEVHLFVINRSGLRNAPADTVPEFAGSDTGITTASWRSDDRVYVLAGKQEEKELRHLL